LLAAFFYSLITVVAVTITVSSVAELSRLEERFENGFQPILKSNRFYDGYYLIHPSRQPLDLLVIPYSKKSDWHCSPDSVYVPCFFQCFDKASYLYSYFRVYKDKKLVRFPNLKGIPNSNISIIIYGQSWIIIPWLCITESRRIGQYQGRIFLVRDIIDFS
jgi:hypothetical protein